MTNQEIKFQCVLEILRERFYGDITIEIILKDAEKLYDWIVKV